MIGSAVTAYLLWAVYRLTARVMIADDAWPRPFPYPDLWLAWLNNYFDRRHPARPGTIKLHGEIARVQLYLLAGAIPFALMTLMGAIRLWHSWRRGQRRGFPVVGRTETNLEQ